MRFWKAIFTIVVVVQAGVLTMAQPPVDRIAEMDEDQVKAVARTFSDRMIRTRDIARLLNEFFVNDFLRRSLLSGQPEWALVVNHRLAANLTEAERRRFFIAINNWTFLSVLYSNSTGSFSGSAGPKSIDVFPPDIRR
ncbi:MAG: hypothetical protein ABR530_09960, partial [Pyrinomonadaceae bacterium]